MNKILQIFTKLFPLWIILSCAIALIYPPSFTWFKGNFISLALGIIMLGMGLTLNVGDFKRIFKLPAPIITSIVLQFLAMPFLGWTLGYVFKLPLVFSIGLIVVSCCPGGTASNVISYLAKADVALSVSMTAFSTLFAIILTPVLTTFYIGNRVSVNALALLFDTFKVVFVPVLLGLAINTWFKKFSERIQFIAPAIAVIFIALIVASIIGAGKEAIISSGINLLLAIICLHTAGFILGYFISAIFIKKHISRRTISIEVGMQNSGLGAVLAKNNFTDPVTAIPSAISSAIHSLIGSILAAYWRRTKQ